MRHAGQIELAVEQHLRRWEAYARDRQADEDDGPALPQVRSWERSVDFDWAPGKPLPLVIVTVPQLQNPSKNPDGWTALLPVTISVTCEDSHLVGAADQAKRILAALRSVLLARPGAAGLQDLTWLGDDYVPVADRGGRRVSAAEASFSGRAAVTGWTLPADPPDTYTPPTEGVPVTSTRLDTEHRLS